MAGKDIEQTLSSFLPPNLPVDGLYSSLKHGSHQRPIAWSNKNVAIIPSWVPDKKDPGLMNPSLRVLSLLLSAEGKARLWDTSMEDILAVHGQSLITHVLWSHSGNYFTTIDEKGKVIIWGSKKYLNSWLPIYWYELLNPVVCCEWINPERMYVASKSDNFTRYEREKSKNLRSPPALVVLTSDGLLTTLFKPAGQVFTHISTNLPQRFVTEDLASSRITHGSMLSGADGTRLVTHSSNILPPTINVYQVNLRFVPEIVFCCDALAILHISNPVTGPGSIMTPGNVLGLQLLPQTATRPYSVAVALASREGETNYKSQIAVWDITPKLMGFHPAFQELSTRRNDAISGQPSLTFVLIGERRFENKFISALTFVPRNRELVIGFSDGSMMGLESRFGGLMDATPTWLDGFHKPQGDYPIVAISPSPNGLSLIYASLNGEISSLYTTETSGYDLDLEGSIQYAILAMLNEWDYSDIISVIVNASRILEDKQLPDRFLEGIFKSYDFIKGAEDTKTIEPFLPRASILRRMLSLQLVLLQTLPDKIIQFRVTCALLHLQSIGEIFSGCCTSDPATLATYLDPKSNIAATAGQKTLAFDPKSLWSLFPLCGWVMDFCTVLFRELYIFLNMKTSNSSVVPKGAATTGNQAAETAPPLSILCFLYNSRARKTLRSVLVLVEQFYVYVRIRESLYLRVVKAGGAIEGPVGQGHIEVNHTNSMSIPEAITMKDIQIGFLSQYVEAAFTRCPLKPTAIKSVLWDLNSLDSARTGGVNTSQRPPEVPVLDNSPLDHIIFIKGEAPPLVSKVELRTIVGRYPILWDINRLMFATIHWLDIEPADKLTETKTNSKRRALAMHPSRCRVDLATTVRSRVPGGVISNRFLPSSLQHNLSNVSTGNMSVGSRGSISGPPNKGSFGTKSFTESPGELPLSQQSNQSMRSSSISQPFVDGSSVMATNGSTSQGRTLDMIGSSSSNVLSIWGLPIGESEDESSNNQPKDSLESRIESLTSVWHNLGPILHERQPIHGREIADVVPDDDHLLEDEDDNDMENQDSDVDMHDGASSSKQESMREIVLASINGGSSVGTLVPSSQWLINESQKISRKTQSEWTVFPIVSDERPSTSIEGDDTKSRLASAGLAGHFTPVDLQSTPFQSYTQSMIEAQVRKRRFGVDPIRKVKKYKTTSNGRRCIRCLQVSTNNSANVRPVQRRPLPHQIGISPSIIPDIAAATYWYHNFDRSCICGGMWLEL